MPKTPQAAASKTTAPPGDRRRIQVRKSGVHGKGVFVLQPIAKGERIIEYKGQVISWPEAQKRHPHDPEQPNHTFYFSLDDGSHVIDGNQGGNASRWINHSCQPNCEADEEDSGPGKGRVFIKAKRNLKPGEELFYDYGLIIDGRHTARGKRDYACHCGSRQCRGTMLAPK